MTGIGRGAVEPGVTALLLPESLRERIAAQAADAAPEECCGLLIGRIEGRRAVVTDCAASPNRAGDPLTAFEIDSALLLRTQRTAREAGGAVLGHYHSHPRGPAGPSPADRDRAWAPGHVWLIAAPGSGGWVISAHLAAQEKGRIVLRPLKIADC